MRVSILSNHDDLTQMVTGCIAQLKNIGSIVHYYSKVTEHSLEFGLREGRGWDGTISVLDYLVGGTKWDGIIPEWFSLLKTRYGVIAPNRGTTSSHPVPFYPSNQTLPNF